jgi:hypothetical protein
MSLDRSRVPGAGGLLLLILVAGLAAGITLGVFHWLATEPIIDAAIAIEEMTHADAEEPVVSRDVQKIGLLVGSAVYGLIFAAFFAVTYVVLRGRGWVQPGWPSIALLGLAAFWSLALFPTLKYPANPPGVGDPESIGMRQTAFVACWALSILGVALAAWGSRRLSVSGVPRVVTLLGGLAVWFAALYLLLPANPDPVTMDAGLIAAFRLRSLLGLGLFWVVLSAVFGALANRPSGPHAHRAPVTA